MKRTLCLTFVIVTTLTVTSCGSSSKVSKEDAEGCKNLVVDATSTINDITTWMRQQPNTEGTRAGYEAAREVANTMAGTSLMAQELSSKSSDKTTKKVYDTVESTFREAALRIAAKGGSFGSYEADLLKTAVTSAEKLSDFCGND